MDEAIDGAYAAAYQDILVGLYQADWTTFASVVQSPYISEAERDNVVYWLRSPLAEEIRKASQVWREYTFSLLMPGEDCLGPGAAGEEVLLQGVVDCFFDTPEGLVVVDFKTDRVSGKEQKLRTEHYRSQVAAYSAALTRIFGRPVARQVLYYFHTGTAVEL